MKKLVAVLLLTASFVSSCFAKLNFFDHRWFELDLNVPVQVSNNYFKVTDLKAGEDFVIDFTEMANSLPNSGFKLIADIQPETGIKFQFGGFSIGAFAGVDFYSNIGLDKSVFDFLGRGNELYEDVSLGGNFVLDTFFTVKVPVMVDVRRIQCIVEANAFIPLVHGNAKHLGGTVKNTPDGKFIVNALADIDFHSIFNYSSMVNSEGQFDFDTSQISFIVTEAIRNNAIGFDLSGNFNYRFSDIYKLKTNYSIPIIPGQLNYKVPIKGSFSYETSLEDAMKPAQEMTPPEFEFKVGDCEYSEYKITRPLRLGAGLEIRPFGSDIITFSSVGGFGVRHPFSSVPGERVFYPEYDISLGFSFGNILKGKVSTSYLNQIFMQQAAIGLNIRLVEINAGVSTQAASFASSFQACGLGAYINLSVGI